MKKLILISTFLAFFSMMCQSQALHIYHDGLDTPDVIANGGIDSIYFAPRFIGSTEYQQVFVTKDGEKRYGVVDSVKFNLPHLCAFRHTYYIPSDYNNWWDGEISLWVSSLGDRQQFVTNSDGKTLFSFYGSGSGGIQHSYYTKDQLSGKNETWYIHGSEFIDSISILYANVPFANNQIKNICFSNAEQEYIIDTDIPGPEIKILNPEDGYGYCNDDGKPVIHLYENVSGEDKEVYIDLSIGGFSLLDYQIDQMGATFKHTQEEHMSALRDFCDSTDYVNWGKNTNWWTDKPLWEWGGRNENLNCYFGRINSPGHHPQYKGSPEDYKYMINDHVVNLDFHYGEYNGIHGKLPPSFEVFLDDVQGDLNLEDCALYGEIPSNIMYNPKWQKYGWYFLNQNTWYGGGFEMDGINLRMKDEEIMYADGKKSTAYEELAKHKLTLLSVGGPSEGMCNTCLSYANKGFAYILAAQNWLGGTQEEAQKTAFELQNIPNVIVCYKSWAKGDLKRGLSNLGSTFLLDSNGYVIDYAGMDFGIGEDFYTNRLGKHLLKYLGEPEEHDPYIPNQKEIYTSSDYSKDGEVVTLQKATIGKGIDLVFMGDQYVDTLLVDGGKYETDMKAAMEYFFEAEPYKMLRDRFNVYLVKAVSPNGNDGPVHKFSYNNDLVFDYVRKIQGVDMDHVAVTVIHNNADLFTVSGETAMWESGNSIAYIEKGGPSSIICHETGGHGIAKLLDEYVYTGYGSNHTQEGANERFRDWIKTTYHDKGWGMNLSATDNPNEVPWAHLLKDERYKDEVGIYQGAWLWPEELWRPSETSIMRESNYLWFNAPSREAIYKTVMQLSEGDGWTYDYEKFVEFDAPIREAYKQARAKARVKGDNVEPIEKRRIELRPPTIYKGSWRDASNRDAYRINDFEKFLGKNPSRARISSGTNKRQDAHKPYIMYKGERIDADKHSNNEFKARFR